LKIQLKPFQDRFLFSDKRYPALIAGIGTGKTLMLLLKIYNYCDQYPNSLALIVRKEYTDLRDSTIKDFQNYFKVTIDTNKEYHLPNGSVIMFRHGAELNVLKNINLSLFGIEQAEEFENDETFQFLRDRLRREGAPYRQGCLIANACGHNWIWKAWINNPPGEEYHTTTASTFDNEDNLPADFIADLKRMEVEAPNHYQQYVLNSFEETGADDILLSTRQVNDASHAVFNFSGAYGRIMAIDVARFGEDETVFSIVEKVSPTHLVQVHQECWKKHDLMEVVGKALDLKRLHNVDIIAVDDTGVGGGVTDRLREMRMRVQAFNGGERSLNPAYFNKRSEGHFIMKEYFDRGYIKIVNDMDLAEQLTSIKYKFKSNGEKAIVSKDDMRKEGFKSPDRADALMIACCYSNLIVRGMPLPGQAAQEFVKQEYNLFA